MAPTTKAATTAGGACSEGAIERHEALLDRAVMKGTACRLSQQPVEAEGSPIPGTGVRVAAALTTPGRTSTVRWSQARLARQEGVTREPAS